MTVCCWCPQSQLWIGQLPEGGRLTLTMGVDDWLDAAAQIEALRFVSLDIDALHSTRLPGVLHKDPADRMTTALAWHFNVPLVTADGKFEATSTYGRFDNGFLTNGVATGTPAGPAG